MADEVREGPSTSEPDAEEASETQGEAQEAGTQPEPEVSGAPEEDSDGAAAKEAKGAKEANGAKEAPSAGEHGQETERADKQRAKELSRQQSRPVSGREAARTVGTGRKQPAKGSGNRRRNGAKGAQTAAAKGATNGAKGGSAKAPSKSPAKAQSKSAGAKGGSAKAPSKGARPQAKGDRHNGRRRAPTSRRSSTSLLTWGTVAVVLLIVIALVSFKVFGGGGGSNAAANTPLPASEANAIATIPASVYDTVGVNSSAEQVTKPTVISGQPPLTFSVNGKQLAGFFYYGAEYCPFCAAERWAVAAALARFGKFDNLRATESSSSDVFPNTQTLSFYKTTLASDYVAFKGVEAYSNQPASGGGYQTLQKPTSAQAHLVQRYDTSKYISALSSSSGGGSIPFIDVGNKLLVAGASYSPAILTGLTRSQIANDLHDPTNPVTQAIITTANYLSAGICATNSAQPASVCTSKGVTEAAKALKLKV